MSYTNNMVLPDCQNNNNNFPSDLRLSQNIIDIS